MADTPIPNVTPLQGSAEQLLETQIRLNKELERTSEAFKGLRTSNVELFQKFAKLNEGLKPLSDDINDLVQGFNEITDKGLGTGKLLNVLATEMLTTSQELAKSLDKSRADYVKTTGEVITFFGAARIESKEAAELISIFGVNTLEARASMIQTLPVVAQFGKEFNIANPELQAMVASLGQLGVSTKTSSENLNIFMDSMKPSGTQINGLNVTLDDAGKKLLDTTSKINELGYSIADAGNMINKNADIITVFGEDALVNLAAQAKMAKLSVDELTSVAAKFETFDSAAQHVGKLNALLGADYLSVTEMMFAEPAEQVKNISTAFQQAGFSLDGLGEQEKRYALLTVQSTLGLKDKTTAMRFLQASSFEQAEILRQEQEKEERKLKNQEDLNRLMMEALPVLEQLTNTFKSLFSILEPGFSALNYFLSMINGWMVSLTSKIREIIPDFGIFGEFFQFLIGGTIFVGLVYLSSSFIKAGKDALNAAKGLADLGKTLPGMADNMKTTADSTKALAGNMNNVSKGAGGAANNLPQYNQGVQQSGTSASAAAKSMLLYGAAILMIGAGIGAAAFGISYLVEAFQGLGDAAVPAAAAVVGFTIAMGFMIYFLASSAVVTATAGTAMLPFAGVVLAIGIAIGIAAAGMGYFVQSFKDLGPAALMFATSLGMIVAPLARLITMIPAFGLLAVAFAGLSLSLLSLGVAARFFNSGGGIKFDLTGIDQLKDFKKDIDELNGKTIKIKVDLELPKLDKEIKVATSAVTPSAAPIERNVTVNIKEIIVKIGNEQFNGYIDGRVEAKLNEIKGI